MWFPPRAMQNLLNLPGIYFYAWEPENLSALGACFCNNTHYREKDCTDLCELRSWRDWQCFLGYLFINLGLLLAFCENFPLPAHRIAMICLPFFSRLLQALWITLFIHHWVRKLHRGVYKRCGEPAGGWRAQMCVSVHCVRFIVVAGKLLLLFSPSHLRSCSLTMSHVLLPVSIDCLLV